MEEFMGLNKISAVGDSGSEDIDSVIPNYPGRIIGPCGCSKHVSRSVSNDDGSLMQKLSRKFFDYLRDLAS